MRILYLPLGNRSLPMVYCLQSKNSGAPTEILGKISHKASEMWDKWEKSERGWQKIIVKYVGMAMDRIEYTEYGLRTIPGLPRAGKLGNEVNIMAIVSFVDM